MSTITHAISAEETQKGKGAEPKINKKQSAQPTAEGEEVKLSKKELSKLAKKESKANAKAGIVTEPKHKGKPQSATATAEPATAEPSTEEQKQE